MAVNSNLGAVVGAEEFSKCPGMGDRQRRFAGLLSVLLALRRLDSKE